MRRPELSVGGQPLVELGQRLGSDAVQPALRVAPDLDKLRILEDAEMLRDKGLAEAKAAGELPDRPLAVAKQLKDGYTAGLSKNLQRGRCLHRSNMHYRLYVCQGT